MFTKKVLFDKILSFIVIRIKSRSRKRNTKEKKNTAITQKGDLFIIKKRFFS